MTMLETRPEALSEFAQRPVTYEQVQRFVEDVKPRLMWQEHLGNMAINHANIVLGEE